MLSFHFEITAQNKSDYIWLGGRNTSTAIGIEGFMLDFNNGRLDINPVSSALEFDMNNVSMCDKEGNLLFYSNGCAIANVNHEIMENGHDINAGEFFELLWLGDCRFGYPGYQDILSIKSLARDNSYYLVTTPVILNNGETYKDVIQYSEIDMNLDAGLGEVTIKNESILLGVEILAGYMTGTQLADGSSWIINISKNPISFIKTKIDTGGIYFHDQQFVGSNLNEESSGGGTSAFSPDGSKYAFFNKYDQLHLFDFDRETGTLSNHKNVFIAQAPLFSSLEFSSNGRFIYIATQEAVFQIDLLTAASEYEVELIAEFNNVQNPQSADMFLLRRGPDCRIYIAAVSESRSYGVINFPNRKGQECELIQQGIELPYMTGVVSLPNFPNYRINEHDVCDSTIVGIYSVVEDLKQRFIVYPNPALEFVNILLPEYDLNGRVEVHNNFGQLMLNEYISGYEMRLDVSGLKSGHYYISISSDNNRFRTEPLIIIR